MLLKKSIEFSVRERFLEAIEETRERGSKDKLSYDVIMENLGGVSQEIAQFRNGKRFPTIKNIYLLAENYSYRLEWIFYGTGRKRALKSKSKKTELLNLLEEAISLVKAK